MKDFILTVKAKATSFAKVNGKGLIYGAGSAIAQAITSGAIAYATTSTSTTLATPTWGATDVVNTVANAVFPAVIPALTVGATVFMAFWIYHRVRGSL
ncbi:MAG: hypothetical protein M0Z50_15535 [Planctomycetia bacterium]|nr:hypothetical protein [Planctomycetia bacterium]